MAGRIPQEFITELLARVDLAQVIGRYVQLKKAGREYKACCPFHSEKTPSFTVTTKGFYHCFGCGAHGTAVSFLMEYGRFSFPEAIEELAKQAGMTVPHDENARIKADKLEPLYECMEAACCYYQEQLGKSSSAKKYAQGRGLSDEICEEYRIGFAPAGFDNIEAQLSSKYDRALLLKVGLLTKKEERTYDKFRNRLMFPIRDTRGRVIAFGGRVLVDTDQPKYMNSPETPLFHKGRILYGLHEIQRRRGKLNYLIITEGYMDVVSLAQSGVRNAVAALGTATTEDHVRQMGRFCRKYLFCFDGDAPGRAAGWRALENVLPVLRDGDAVGFAYLPEGEDPDSYIRNRGMAAWKAFLGESVSLEEYFFAHLAEGLKLDTIAGKSKLVAQARPLLARMPDTTFRDLMINQLSEMTGLTVGQLHLDDTPQVAEATTRQKTTQGSGRPSLMRKMIRLLLEYPQLAVHAPSHLTQQLNAVELKGASLFAELFELAYGQKNINAGAMIQAIRDSQGVEMAQHLGSLMSWTPIELTGDEKQVRKIFEMGLGRLQGERIKAQRSRVNTQLQKESLSTKEQAQLKERLEKLAGQYKQLGNLKSRT